jgi:photosystem II stability/assembly factor-like uncharacterized protein
MSHRARLLPVITVFALAVSAVALRADDPSPLPQILKALRPRLIGPANMSGRIVDVAVYEKEPRIQYVASATGGLWKTTNNGQTWKPTFERETTVSLGAVAVCQTNPDLVWVGTGEGNLRNSVSWGDGVYRSTDGGKTWQHRGLKETQHIGRVAIHPTKPDVVYVAAVGRAWAANPERGLYKTTDGGATWQHVLKLDAETGCVDVAIDPETPDVVYAAAYRVRRDAFAGGNPAVQTGPAAGIYKTADGGKSWKKLAAGLPDRPLGRCGLSIYRKDPKTVFAVVQTDKTPVTVQGQPANQKKKNVATGGIFRSDDRGETWTHVNSLVPRPFYYGQIRVDPSDSKRVYVLGIALHVSNNGGKTFAAGSGAKGTHSDYHALWIDPRDSHHLVLGCDGGLNYSYDRSQTWEHLKNLPVAQFYAVGVDMKKPYTIYGGLQDNGTWGGPSANRDLAGITIADWVNILGFDGYYCQPDPDDPDVVFAEGQYGILRRINARTGAPADIKPRLATKKETTNIVPKPADGSPAFRFNWSSPILLSKHKGKPLYFGGNYLFRSDDRGDHWKIVSPDLTRGEPGPSAYSGHTLTTVAESPLKAGLIWTGSDDGRVCMTHSGGQEWLDVSHALPGLPPERWISRVECSRFAEGTVYLAVDRHRNDDRTPYLFRTTDHGRTWTSLAAGLPPGGPVYVIREDPTSPNLLYAGTELGLYVSTDGGATWRKQAHLPTVPVHDLLIHPRDHELVIATHGRGIYLMDVRPLQELTPRVLAEPAYVCPIRPTVAFYQRSIHKLGLHAFAGENPPYGAAISFYLREAPEKPPVVTITDAKGTQLAELKGAASAGLQHVTWRPVLGKSATFRPVPSGTYTATLRAGPVMLRREFQVTAEE